jgi:hypothetical protein
VEERDMQVTVQYAETVLGCSKVREVLLMGIGVVMMMMGRKEESDGDRMLLMTAFLSSSRKE